MDFHNRDEEIETAWFQELIDSGAVSQANEQSHAVLHDLIYQITRLISHGQFQAEEARTIGSKIALLGIQRVDALTALQTILYHHISPGIDPSQVECVSTYLGNIFIEITAGFIIQLHTSISPERDQTLRIEEELRASEARYRNVIEDQTEIIVRWKPDTIITFVNTAACSFAGLRYDQLVGYPFNNFLKPIDQIEVRKFFSTLSALTPENPFNQGQAQFVSFMNEVRWIQWRTRAIFDDNQQIVEFQTVASDITKVKRIQDELRESEERYRSVVETQNEFIGRFTSDGIITFVNAAATRIFGVSPQAMIGHNILDFVPKNALDTARAALASTFTLTPQNNSIARELTVTGASGGPIDIEVTTHAIFDNLGNTIEYQTTGRDVTELRQAESALVDSEARYRSVIEGQSELIIRFLPDTTISFVNDAVCRYFSLTTEEILGKSALEFVYKEDQPARASSLSELASRTPNEPFHSGETRVNLPNGEYRWIQWTTRIIFDESGQINEYQSVGRDITELKLAQEKMEQQNELLRQLSEQMINVQEIERQRIARELHDSILNELGAILIGPPENITPKNIRDNYEHLIEQIRQTINDLRSPMLNYGLYAALEDLCDNLTDNPQVEDILTMDIPPSQSRFDTNTELHLFRILQQACDNALQHAQADHIRIHGEINDHLVDITVEDDGIGFQPGSEIDMAQVLAKKHYGLVSMLERAKLIGANVKFFSNPGAGTQVRVLWEENHN